MTAEDTMAETTTKLRPAEPRKPGKAPAAGPFEARKSAGGLGLLGTMLLAMYPVIATVVLVITSVVLASPGISA